MPSSTPSFFGPQGIGASVATNAGGAVSDIFAAEGAEQSAQIQELGLATEATDYTLASNLAAQNEQYTKESTGIQEAQQNRQVTQAMGRTTAQVAGAGFANSGTALNLMRSNAQQGSIAQAVTGQQGLMTEAGYQEESTAYSNMATEAKEAESLTASAANTAATGDIIGSVFKAGAAIASLPLGL